MAEISEVALAGNQHSFAVFVPPESAFLGVEPKLGLARLLVRPVALISIVRKDWQDIAAEIDVARIRGRNEWNRGNDQESLRLALL